MIKRDLLQRQIEELGSVLGKMISDLYRLKGTGKIGIKIDTLSHTLKSQLDLDIEQIIEIPDKDFIKTLQRNAGFSHENMEKLSDLLFFAAENGQASDSAKLYEKCLVIYEFLEKEEQIYSFERRSKIAEMEKRLHRFFDGDI